MLSHDRHPGRRRQRVVTLHATGEAELLRAGDERSLARLPDFATGSTTGR